MKTIYTIIRDNGDGSQSTFFVKDCTYEELYEKAAADKFDSYQSGDGIQISKIEFPDEWDLNMIKGIYWETIESLFEEDEYE